MTVPVSNVDLMERVCHLTNKIYREMLCITRHKGKTYITIRGLDGLDDDQVNGSSKDRTLLYLVPCISARIFIIPKLQNIVWIQYIYISIGELFSLHRTSFLTVILLDPVPFQLRIQIGALANTFPMLFLLKGFFIYSDSLVQNTLCVITTEN